jgi:hypothetical protein
MVEEGGFDHLAGLFQGNNTSNHSNPLVKKIT